MDAIMDAVSAPHREAHHAAPEPGGYEAINPQWFGGLPL